MMRYMVLEKGQDDVMRLVVPAVSHTNDLPCGKLKKLWNNLENSELGFITWWLLFKNKRHHIDTCFYLMAYLCG